MKTLIVASNNNKKIEEIKDIFAKNYIIRSMGELGISLDIAETGSTFSENAVIKAVTVFKLINDGGFINDIIINIKKEGFAVISDDSGLSVDALNGEPGVYSARYSPEGTDEKNNQKLLKNLTGKSNRQASFVSAIALVKGENDIVIASAECKGEILTSPKGEGGFGYDPLFFSYDLNKTFGEASKNEKNSISHRAKALSNLLKKLQNTKA